MLTSTFVLLKGLGPWTERRLWQDGVIDWSAFLKQPTLSGMSPARKAWYDQDLAAAAASLEAGQAEFFRTGLKSRDHWRLFEAFGHRALYLDIETNGMGAHMGRVTVVGFYRNGRMSSLVWGENLTEERLHDELEQTDLLVTFNGSSFDIPYLRTVYPRLNFKKAHFDLCFVARRLGMQGGLKFLERELQIDRDADLQGLDGWDAVRLWQQWRGGDETALDLLLRYNAADARNLEPLAHLLYERMVAQYGPNSVRAQLVADRSAGVAPR